MPATYTSSFTNNLSVKQVGSGPDGEIVSADTLSQALDVTTGPSSSDEEGMALQLGGDAIAVGEDTLATAEVVAGVAGNESVQSAHGSASFSASGSGDSGTYAAATSYGEIYGDADYGLCLNFSSESTCQDGESIVWEATSVTEVFALDIDGVPVQSSDASALEPPPPDLEDPAATTPESDPEWAGSVPIDDWSGGIDGNVVIFDVAADAVGEDSFVEVDVLALTVEDQLSTVTVVVTAAIG